MSTYLIFCVLLVLSPCLVAVSTVKMMLSWNDAQPYRHWAAIALLSLCLGGGSAIGVSKTQPTADALEPRSARIDF